MVDTVPDTVYFTSVVQIRGIVPYSEREYGTYCIDLRRSAAGGGAALSLLQRCVECSCLASARPPLVTHSAAAAFKLLWAWSVSTVSTVSSARSRYEI